jgi:hypothetical protein
MSEEKSKAPEPALLKCPLCEGRGELPEQEMFDRLREKDLCRKIASYMDTIVDAEARVTPSEPETPQGPRLVDPKFKSEVDTWNLTHFLWRRSPKE